jgi:hypothetical protein
MNKLSPGLSFLTDGDIKGRDMRTVEIIRESKVSPPVTLDQKRS